MATLIEDVVQVRWDDADDLRSMIEQVGEDKVAAFFCEPVIGAGGVYPAPHGYLSAVRAVCRETGVLFVADEVITGFGRCGAWFASGRLGLEPDIITCAKGITSGYLPMGAVVAAPWIAEPFWAEGAGVWRHGYTYSGHAAASAAALANLDIMEREGLCERALDLETDLTTALAPLSEHALVMRSGAGPGCSPRCSWRPPRSRTTLRSPASWSPRVARRASSPGRSCLGRCRSPRRW